MATSYLIIGNGIAGITAAESLRLSDPSCQITIVSDMPFPAYYRPALKDFLAGTLDEAKLWALPSSFYREQRIRFVLGRVQRLAPLDHTIFLHDGSQLTYDKLLIASGSHARKLSCPGSDLANVFTLHTLADYQRLRPSLLQPQRVVVYGGGPLAIETVETLHRLGHSITHLFRSPLLWSEILDQTASDLVLQAEHDMGVSVHPAVEIQAIIDDHHSATTVVTTQNKRFSCDLVILAIGIEANMDFLSSSGIIYDHGIRVNASMQTNVPDIYAAGDVIEVQHHLTRQSRLLGQWYPAIQQAHIAARSMQQSSLPSFRPGNFYNATFLSGLPFVSIGYTRHLSAAYARTYQELVAPPTPRSYHKIVLNQAVPVGALFIGDRSQALAFKRAIDHQISLAPILDHIFSPSFDLNVWLDQQQVPPALLNAEDHVSLPGFPPLPSLNTPTMGRLSALKPTNSVTTNGLLSAARSTGRVHTATTSFSSPRSHTAQLIPISSPALPIHLTEIHLHPESLTTIGRQQGATLFIDHRSVSRNHASITCINGSYMLRDIGSSYGTYVNGQALAHAREHTLQNGDILRFGDAQFRFHYQPLPATTSLSTGKPTASHTQVTAGLPTRHVNQTYKALTPPHIQFEIDMCIGCNRCMDICPVPTSSPIHISELNTATLSGSLSSSITQFTQDCILCGSCVPVCPVDNHRDLLMLSLKQHIQHVWDNPIDPQQISPLLPSGWSLPLLLQRLREHPVFQNTLAISDTYLLHLIHNSTLHTYIPGAVCMVEGEYNRDLYVIIDGSLTLSVNTGNKQETSLAIFNRGEYVGEYGMLTGQPATMTARAEKNATILHIPEQTMLTLMDLVPAVRTFFTQLNNARSLQAILHRMPLFAGVPTTIISQLAHQAQVTGYDRDARVFADTHHETLHVILEGFVKVSQPLPAHPTSPPKQSERVLAYRQGGDYFTGGLDPLGGSKPVLVTTITRTRVAELPSSILRSLFQQYPEVAQRFQTRLHAYKLTATALEQGHTLSPQSNLQTLVEHGIVEGTEVLVIDLHTCIHCGECEEACTRRHGHPRLNRKGPVLDHLSIATACRQCQDPVCLLCSRAGIARHPTGEVYITDSCIGCGICAERCPYGAISLIDAEPEPASHSSWQRFNQLFLSAPKRSLPVLSPTPSSGRTTIGQDDALTSLRKKIASKCDLCAGFADQACIEACPTGAAFRVQPTHFFGSTEDILLKPS